VLVVWELLGPPLRSGAKQLEASIPVSKLLCDSGQTRPFGPKLALVQVSGHVERSEVELGR
jgi:hypothetical protein